MGQPSAGLSQDLPQDIPSDLAQNLTERKLLLSIPPAVEGRTISIVIEPGLAKTRNLPEGLRPARVAMLADQPVAPELLRALADFRDGLAALRYVRHQVANGGSNSDIAHYGCIAVATGRVWPLADTIAALALLDPATEPTERIQFCLKTVYEHAWAGNTLALDAIILLTGPGRLFGDLSDDTRQRLLRQAERIGDGRIELQMALALMREPNAGERPTERIRDYLTRAGKSSHPGVQSLSKALMAIETGESPVLALTAPVESPETEAGKPATVTNVEVIP